MSKRLLAIDRGTVFTPRDKLANGRIIIDGSSIVEVGEADRTPLPASAHVIDAQGLIVTPGFIEPHIHGCGGVDLMEATPDAVHAVSRIVARHGTTSFLATTVSSSPEKLTNTVEKLGAIVGRNFDGARPLGIHLEGPFINTLQRGTHKASNITAPDPQLLYDWYAASAYTIRLVTIAPELEGSKTLSLIAARYGIRLAMGHSNATFEEAGSAADDGVCYAVHTFNAMRAFSHREPGIVGAVLSDDRIFAEIIADGIHVHPAAIGLLARSKPANRILLVTDAISATDMPDGSYALGTDSVTVTNGVCRDADGRLAGSTLTQEIALSNFVRWTGFSLEHALPALTENPARALGLQNKGIIAPGADADLALLDADFHVVKTIVAGKLVFER